MVRFSPWWLQRDMVADLPSISERVFIAEWIWNHSYLRSCHQNSQHRISRPPSDSFGSEHLNFQICLTTRWVQLKCKTAKGKLKNFIRKEFSKESMNLCPLLALLSQKKDRCIYADKHAINKIIMNYKFLILRLEDILDILSGAAIFTECDPWSSYQYT